MCERGVPFATVGSRPYLACLSAGPRGAVAGCWSTPGALGDDMQRTIGTTLIAMLLALGLATPAAAQACIDINEADAEQLQSLMHIGPDRAAQILELRPFDSVDDLVQVDGLNGTGVRLDELKAAPGEWTPPCDVDNGEPVDAAQVATPAPAGQEPEDEEGEADEVDTVEEETDEVDTVEEEETETPTEVAAGTGGLASGMPVGVLLTMLVGFALASGGLAVAARR
jgi:hypothetical protein